ncbi:glycoside hydrolase family 2 protein [Actinoplanes sp. NPDC049668]|uniref:glycoside hydrolase family 2 protein n=1 Tax=unclassified Actinoplanes TaxID=2626549 RepID=UPI0033A8AAFE
MLQTLDLGGSWELRADGALTELAGVAVPAVVPGCVHVDLLNDGRLPDPFRDDNEKAVAWVGRTDWRYTREVAWTGDGHERVDLVFDGLDTVAAVELGGELLGTTRNMHRGYRYDVTAALGDGAARPLTVRFTSAYTEAEQVRDLLGARANAYPEPFNFIRKMACGFGWDWGPTLVTAGIWRPVRLEAWSVARLAAVRPLATWAGGAGRLDLTVEAERLRDTHLSLRVLLDGREVARGELPPGDSRSVIGTTVAGVRPWAPIGYGEPVLYDLTVELSAGDVLLDRWQRRTGFRGVAVDRGPDAAGSRFVIEVNGEPVLVKGVNWIPDDIFPSRMTRERYERRLREAADAGVNLIRVWGGGIYEDRAFYEAADELGLLVWQDFLFACACYPEEEPLYSEVLAEARENVARLAPHPSLITWCGNNENLWLRGAMRWDRQEGGDLTWGERYYLETLPRVVAELDPSRPYQAGTPWSGSWDHPPNDAGHGTFHSWEVWNREDYADYRDSAPRFVAEFGWQAPPAWTTLRDAVSDDPMLPDSPGVLHHQKAEDGNGKLARGLAPHFGAPAGTEAWHYLTQLNQVRAVRTGIEHWRSHWPHTGGTILWQLNDLWPVTSWAAIDGAGRYKPLYFELKALHAARGLTVQPRGSGLVVAVLNDSPRSWSGRLAVRRSTAVGEPRAAWAVRVDVPARQVSTVEIPEHVTALGVGELLVAELDGARALWFGVPDKDFAHPDAGLTVTADPAPGGLEVRVRAAGLARDVLVQADRIHPEAVADRGFFTLLPGESVTVRVRGPFEPDPALLEAPWVITDLASVLRLGLAVR